MLIRIVHMYFTKDGAEKFLQIFKESREAIRGMDGCTHLELLHDIDDPAHFVTFSHWDTASHLNQYRSSVLFRDVWGRVKPLFSFKPLAHSFQVTSD